MVVVFSIRQSEQFPSNEPGFVFYWLAQHAMFTTEHTIFHVEPTQLFDKTARRGNDRPPRHSSINSHRNVTDNFCRLPWTSCSPKDETVCWCGSRWTAGIRSTATSSAPPRTSFSFRDDDARADAPVSCTAIRHASVKDEHTKTNEAKRCASLAQRSTGRSFRAAEHRFSRLLINNAALLMATKLSSRRAQTGNGRSHKCFRRQVFRERGSSRLHRTLMPEVRCFGI